LNSILSNACLGICICIAVIQSRCRITILSLRKNKSYIFPFTIYILLNIKTFAVLFLSRCPGDGN
jgi:hypothetical protein